MKWLSGIPGRTSKLRPSLWSNAYKKPAFSCTAQQRAYHNPLEVFHKQPFVHKSLGAAPLPSDEPIEEEKHPGYDPSKRYYPRPGEIIGKRYEAIAKLGFGGSSSTWLVRDLDRWRWDTEDYCAMKIGGAEPQHAREGDEPKEVKVIQHLFEAIDELDPSIADGAASIRIPEAYTAFEGPNGLHRCIMYPPMRETMYDWRNVFASGQFPLFAVKIYVAMLLKALSLMHARRTLHTDIKLKNILMTYEDDSVLQTFVQLCLDQPSEYKMDAGGRCIYRSRNVFPGLKEPILKNLAMVLPKLADFSVADIQPAKAFSITPAQPHHYRAPEMLLGLPYSTPVDIWNLGVLLWDLVEGRALFDTMPWSLDEYDPALHVAHIYALLGKPSTSFAEQVDENEFKDREFPTGGLRWTSRQDFKKTPQDMFDGPHLDREGNILRPHLVPMDFSMEGSTTRLSGAEKADFMRFARRLLTWDPEERATAAELCNDPWLAPFGGEED